VLENFKEKFRSISEYNLKASADLQSCFNLMARVTNSRQRGALIHWHELQTRASVKINKLVFMGQVII
jgi:uncharacterized protein Yka (UPF0111/DUF47 family)